MTDDSKPPMDHKVQRPFAWIGSERHNTDEGRNDFWHRQQERMRAAYGRPEHNPQPVSNAELIAYLPRRKERK